MRDRDDPDDWGYRERRYDREDDWAYRERRYHGEDDWSVRRQPRKSDYPIFCKVIFILDIVFCSFRLIMAPLAFVGYVMIQKQNPNDPLLKSALAEGMANGLIGLFGLTAAILMLMRKKIGAVLGGVAILCTLAGIGVAAWQATIQFETQGLRPGTPEYGATLAVIVLGTLIRLGLLALYAWALVVFLRLPPPRRVVDPENEW